MRHTPQAETAMTGLAKSDFGSFFEEIHGYPPFKWQAELANQVFDHGWPKALKMPTASGKTSVIDIAVFHLALEAGTDNRKAPLRIIFVVDRRLVVDDAFEHAHSLAEKVSKCEKPVTKKVRDALKAFDNPLDVVKLRGGMPKESDWAETPDRPLIITSTVDQVGSRLLFRGYGVSDSMKPVHAGLLGSDVLYILDEADTSKPFLDTLNQISDIREREWGSQYPFAAVFMSATLQYDHGDIFPKKGQEKILLDDEKIRERINAHKYATLIAVSKDHEMVDKIVESAISLSPLSDDKEKAHSNIRSVGIVVNRVKMARDVFSAICEKIKKCDNASAHLLTGRVRPLDRDMFVKNQIEAIRPNNEEGDGTVMFFVATQCIEVGVNIDFDALVTQIAPLDSLRQRFGRLDRIGRNGKSEARIIASKSSIKKDDYVYGDRLANTWKLLNSIAEDRQVDLGIGFFEPGLSKERLEEVTSPKPRSVTLMPSYIRAWSQTSPRPYPDPDPSLFLHGHETKSADVQIIWRADVTEETLDSAKNSPECVQSVFITPPSALEAVSIPIWTARKWLAGHDQDQHLSDVEGMKAVPEEEGDTDRYVLLWRGAKNKQTRVIKPTEMIPGDTIVVPSTYGGCDKYGWDDYSDAPVDDIGMEANLIHRRQLTMRFDRNIITKMGDSTTWEDFKEVEARHAERDDTAEFIAELIDSESFPQSLGEILKVVKDDIGKESQTGSIKIHKRTEGDSSRIFGLGKNNLSKDQVEKILVCLNLQESLSHQKTEKHAESTTDDGSSSSPGQEIGLTDHCKGVQAFAKKFVRNIKMNPDVSNDVELAALLHDIGKAEKRFQAFLYGTDPDDLLQEKIIAKSAHAVINYREYEQRRKTAQFPEGQRHECWSVLLSEGHPRFRDAKDPDLVRYLIGTHHGHGRPMFPPVKDDGRSTDKVKFEFDGKTIVGSTEQELSRLDSGWIDMHHRVYTKYGPWNLAHMEAIVRLADHCRSREEEKNA